MKIVFLSTGRGLRAEFIHDLRTKLGLDDSDVVCLVSWHPARAPLPVNRHLVLGPHLRLAGDLATVQRVQRPPERIGAEADKPSVTSPAVAAGATMATGTGAGTGTVNATAHLPVLHPRRIRQAVAWRVRRLKKATRTRTSARLAGVQTHPQFRRVRNRLTPGVSLSFAASCLRAGKVHDMARDADLVVALDAASHRGAWTLAQKVAGPDVVIGVPAAKRLVEQRQASTAI